MTAPPQPSSDLAVGVRADTYEELSRRYVRRGLVAAGTLALAVALYECTALLSNEDIYMLGGSFGTLMIARFSDAIRYGWKASRLRIRLTQRRYRGEQ